MFGERIQSLCALLFLLCTFSLLAQVNTESTIVGTVTDSQKAVMPGVAVALKNVDTGIEWNTRTGGAGEFVFPNLIAGRYEVSAAAAGFKKAKSAVTPLQNGMTLRLNIAMELGQVTQEVTVTAAAPLVHTDDADVNTVLQTKMLAEMPVLGRNFVNVAAVVPQFNSGTGDNSRLAWSLGSSTMPDGQVMNLGGTELSVGYYVDGVANADNWMEGPVINVNMDAVQEVKADVANYSAEYGREIGQMSFTTKSGTNQLHGTLFDSRQVNGLNARDPWSKYVDPTAGRDGWHQDQYGYTLGGPVYIPRVFNGRNKMFFFSSWERLRRRGSYSYLTYVPTDREKQGDFGEWLERFPDSPRMVVYDPYSFNPETQERTPYPENKLQPNPLAAAYLSHFPKPNFVSSIPEDFSNYRATGKNGLNDDNFANRIDYWVSEKDRLYFKWSRATGRGLNQGDLIPELTLGNGPVHKTHDLNGHWLHTFSPTLNNEVVVGYLRGQNVNEDPASINRYLKVDWLRDLFKNTSLTGAGLSDFDKQQMKIDSDAFFNITLDGHGGGLSLGPGEYYYQVVPQLQIADNLIKVAGRHTLKAGFHYFRRDERDNDVIRQAVIGNGFTGRGPDAFDGSGWNTIAEFETGAVAYQKQRTLLSGGDGSLYFRMPEWAAFVNDTWQVSGRLTLNLGLRYDLAIPAYSVDSYWGVLDQTYPGWRMIMPGTTPGTSNHPFPADKNNVAPRFGLAYRLNDKTTLRGGYGLFHETGRYKFMDQMFFNSPGYGGSEYYTWDQAVLQGKDPNEVAMTLDNTFAAPVTINKGDWPIPLGDKGGVKEFRSNTTTIDKQTPITPYQHRFSFEIQRGLGSNMMVSLNYTGSMGRSLTIADDLNLPPQGVYLNNDDFDMARPLCQQDAAYCDRFASVLAIHHNGYNDYNAATVSFEKRFSRGLSILSHLTWSKMTDITFNNQGYTNVSAIGGQWHREWSHSVSDADHPYRGVIYFSYELPFAKQMRGLSKLLLNGWQINALYTAESGNAYTVYNGDTSSRDYMGDVPLRLADGNLARGERTFYRYFDTGAFVNPADSDGDGIADSRGNAGRNIIRGPGINNWDASMFKKFQIGEEKHLEFRWEMFNAFNHTQWSGIDTYDDRGTNESSTFGRINGGRAGRRIQFQMRFTF